MDKILRIENVSKEFHGVKALNNVSFSVRQGDVHAIIGENGAGKSTLMNILSGVHRATSGRILLEGKEIKFDNPKDAQLAGVSIIHQEFSLIPDLNGVENIFLGREIRKANGLLDKKGMLLEAKNLLKKLEANIDLDVPVKNLSIANQQYIEIAKAIFALDIKVLIFDEPTTSLTNEEIEKLFKLIENLKDDGVTIIYISHDLDEILHLCDRLTVLRDGELVDTKDVKDCTKQYIVKMMVGREIDDIFPEKSSTSSNDKKSIVLEVKKLKNNIVSDIEFNLKEGEIIGFAGLVGSGRTETIRALIGVDAADEKEIYINGRRVNINNPGDALSHGIGLIPEDRKSQGLILNDTIKNNISLTVLNKLTNKFKMINRKKENEIVDQSIKDLLIKTSNRTQAVNKLSGGNQQKVVLAKWLNTDSKILIFDEPTRGIDIGAKEEIYKIIRSLADQGMSIILVSSELPEILGLSDRIVVMHQRRIKAIMNGKEATQEKIMYYATGGVNR